MRGGDNGTNTRLSDWYRRIADAQAKHSRLEQLTRELMSQRCVTDHDRGNRRFTQTGIESQALQAFFKEFRVCPKLLDQLRLLFQHFKGGDTAGGDGRRVRGGKQERPGAVMEEFNNVTGRTEVSAQGG